MSDGLTVREFLEKWFTNSDENSEEILKLKYLGGKLGKQSPRNFMYSVLWILRKINGEEASNNFSNQATPPNKVKGTEKIYQFGKCIGAICGKNTDGDRDVDGSNHVKHCFDKKKFNEFKENGYKFTFESKAADVLEAMKEISQEGKETQNAVWIEAIKKILCEQKEGIIMKETIKTLIDETKIKQFIFTGAPGTGKTYAVREFVMEESKRNESRYSFVQFHPSYDYSDFVEGLRPVCIGDSYEPTFVKLDGTFKAFCRKIVEKNFKYAAGEKEFNKDNFNEMYQKVQKSDKHEKNTPEYKFQNGEHKYFFVIDEINRADLSKVFGELMFGLEESYRGIKNRFDTQYKNLKTYEIDENGKGKVLEFDCFEDGFFIPENLYIIGTMNDIDRSVESFDFALRRRFRWIDIKANEVMQSTLESMLNKKDDSNLEKSSTHSNQPNGKGASDSDNKKIGKIAERIMAMNEIISSNDFQKFGLSEAYHIGPAYFKELDVSSDETVEKSLRTIFEQKVTPILQEYTRGRKKEDIDKFVEKCGKKLLESIKEQSEESNKENNEEDNEENN